MKIKSGVFIVKRNKKVIIYVFLIKLYKFRFDGRSFFFIFNVKIMYKLF